MYKIHLKDNGSGEFKRTWYLRGDYPPIIDSLEMTPERASVRQQGMAEGLLVEHRVKGWSKQKKAVLKAI